MKKLLRTLRGTTICTHFFITTSNYTITDSKNEVKNIEWEWGGAYHGQSINEIRMPSIDDSSMWIHDILIGRQSKVNTTHKCAIGISENLKIMIERPLQKMPRSNRSWHCKYQRKKTKKLGIFTRIDRNSLRFLLYLSRILKEIFFIDNIFCWVYSNISVEWGF